MDKVLRGLTYFFTFVTFGTLAFILLYILVTGIPHLSTDLFAWKYTTGNVSMTPAIITTLYLVAGSLLIAVPLGVFAGGLRNLLIVIFQLI